MFESWDSPKLQDFITKLEEMYMQGVKETRFQGQLLAFDSVNDIRLRLRDGYREMVKRGLMTANNKKYVAFQTRGRGFME